MTRFDALLFLILSLVLDIISLFHAIRLGDNCLELVGVLVIGYWDHAKGSNRSCCFFDYFSFAISLTAGRA